MARSVWRRVEFSLCFREAPCGSPAGGFLVSQPRPGHAEGQDDGEDDLTGIDEPIGRADDEKLIIGQDPNERAKKGCAQEAADKANRLKRALDADDGQDDQNDAAESCNRQGNLKQTGDHVIEGLSIGAVSAKNQEQGQQPPRHEDSKIFHGPLIPRFMISSKEDIILSITSLQCHP